MRMRMGGVVAVVALGLLAGCDSGGSDEGSGTTSTSAPTSSTSSTPGSPQDNADEVMLKDFAFDPFNVTVSQGAVALRLANTGKAPHTFTMDNPKIDQRLAPGGSGHVVVSLPAPGEYVFYCRFHRAQGMQGKLTLRSP